MSRSRRDAPTVNARRQRLPPPTNHRFSTRWLIVSGVVLLVLVGLIVLVGGLAARPGVTGIQAGPPPWPPETAHLRARLTAIGLPVLTAEGVAQHTHQHLDLSVDGSPVTVPSDIGINRSDGFLSPIHTHDATGIIHVESPVIRDFTLGEFFDVWGVRFDAHCIGDVCDGNGRTLSIFVNGQPYTGDPRSLVLAAHQEIAVAIGTSTQLPSPVPSSFAFPAGL